MEVKFPGTEGDQSLKTSSSPSSYPLNDGGADDESSPKGAVVLPSTSNGSSSKTPGKITVSFKDITFNSDFDSGNLARVEEFKGHGDVDWREFDLWVSSDCEGTEFVNGNRSWFYFSVTVPQNYVGKVLRFNIMNLNRQMKLYMQGLAPMIKILPGRGNWDRLRTRISYEYLEASGMKLSFYFNITDSRKHTLYFAFCYPFSYTDCQRRLEKLDGRFKKEDNSQIYYHRELLCKSLEGRRIDLITVTSTEGMSQEKEERLPHLFPDEATERCHVFKNKKVVFISSRVHPGETPSSHVFNGVLQFLLRSDDERAIAARRHFVFKLIPMLNPDGVFRGHYRTDSRGVNLNRFYLDPDRTLHPSVFGARSMMLYYHSQVCDIGTSSNSFSSANSSRPYSSSRPHHTIRVSRPRSSKLRRSFSSASASRPHSSAQSRHSRSPSHLCPSFSSTQLSSPCNVASADNSNQESFLLRSLRGNAKHGLCRPTCKLNQTEATLKTSDNGCLPGSAAKQNEPNQNGSAESPIDSLQITRNSGVALYVDLHAHAAKRGVFIYGNYFKDVHHQAENMLLPKLVSLNSPHLDFEHCVFSERNMYATDKKTGLSKEGSGRVGIYKATGIIPCYTLECNYNSGRQCNAISNATTDSGRASPGVSSSSMSHRFSIADFEEVGRALIAALLDYHHLNPWSRLPTTSYGSLAGVRQSLMQRLHVSRATKNSSDDSESPRNEDKIIHEISSSSVEDYQEEVPSCVHAAFPKRPHLSHTFGKANGLIKRSRKSQNMLESGNSSCANLSSKREQPHELKPKLTNVMFPPSSIMTEDVSNPILQEKISKKPAIGKFCKGSTMMVKKTSNMDGIIHTSQNQQINNPIRLGTVSRPIISTRQSIPGSSRREHLGSRGSILVGHRRMETSMLHKGVSNSSPHQVPSRTAPQTPAISTAGIINIAKDS